MKIRGKKVEQGMKIKTKGLTAEEKEILIKALRRIGYKRRRENRSRLKWIIDLN
ncbi:MAG: hypothetical protein LBM69_07195 [Lachnospiraceae bacterium]|jgi:hypothetical protein|nr:hypothetical protein [Lachnospiraceae bacterium]